MDRNQLTSTRRQSGFTLVEIMLVVLIMAILMTVAVVNSSSSLNSLRMKQAIASVISTVDRARQVAMTTNKEIIVRIYKDKDERGVAAWRTLEYGIASFITDPANKDYQDPGSGNYKPIFKRTSSTEKLPQGFIFNPSVTYSTLLDSANTALLCGTEDAPSGGTHDYVSFVCKPDGLVELPTTTTWTLTIVNEDEQDRKGTALPANYATLQLEPRTTRFNVFRP